tara:strand:+ start:80 stop:274 length:195 start_codon:yes stop_codon:yes gene_type:complete
MTEDIRNSFKINKDGVLESVLENEDTGVRIPDNPTNEDIPKHLRHLDQKAINNLKYLFRGGFTS